METTLYERDGHPVAYIADDQEHSIYTWDGHAVCYILDDKIYGWKGHHIGWFVYLFLPSTFALWAGMLFSLSFLSLMSARRRSHMLLFLCPIKRKCLEKARLSALSSVNLQLFTHMAYLGTSLLIFINTTKGKAGSSTVLDSAFPFV